MLRQAWASLLRGEVRIDGLQIARSASSDRNLFECDSATLALNLNALAHRRIVVDKGEIHGIRLDTLRHFETDTSDSVTLAVPDLSPLAQQGQNITRSWARLASRALERRVEEEFQSLREVREIAARWPAHYQDLQQQVRQCHQAALQLYESIVATRSGGTLGESVEQLNERAEEVLRLRQRVAHLQQQLSQLVQQTERDRTSIMSAFANDTARLRQAAALTDLQDQPLSSYLLDDEIRHWSTQLQEWLQLVRWLNQSPDANQLGQRGRLVEFVGSSPQADMLIRSAAIDGGLLLAGHQVHFQGMLQNWAVVPATGTRSQQQPAHVELVLQGPCDAALDCGS